MTKTEIENKIHDLKRNIERCENIIESCENIIKANENEIKKLEAEKEKPAFERVKKGEKYYSIGKCPSGEFASYLLTEREGHFDEHYFKNNNYFLTKERSEEVADKINFLLKLERLHDTFCPDYKPDWDNKSEAKWTVVFDYDEKKYAPYWSVITDNHTIVYFNSRKTAKKVCDILNEEEIGNETL
jgi:hypothetical protein